MAGGGPPAWRPKCGGGVVLGAMLRRGKGTREWEIASRGLGDAIYREEEGGEWRMAGRHDGVEVAEPAAAQSAWGARRGHESGQGR
jgi:hypothetical protein